MHHELILRNDLTWQEPKHAANYVLIDYICVLCLTELVTLAYYITQRNGTYRELI